jgi:hypothetical protein
MFYNAKNVEPKHLFLYHCYITIWQNGSVFNSTLSIGLKTTIS